MRRRAAIWIMVKAAIRVAKFYPSITVGLRSTGSGFTTERSSDIFARTLVSSLSAARALRDRAQPPASFPIAWASELPRRWGPLISRIGGGRDGRGGHRRQQGALARSACTWRSWGSRGGGCPRTGVLPPAGAFARSTCTLTLGVRLSRAFAAELRFLLNAGKRGQGKSLKTTPSKVAERARPS